MKTRTHLLAALSLGALITPLASPLPAQETQPQPQAEQVQLRDLPARDFLAVIRNPLRADAWSVITGKLTQARNGQPLLKGDVRLSIRLSERKMITQITLNERNTYILDQTYDRSDTGTRLELDLPRQETRPGLFDFGLRPDDLSFAFFYWDFLAEDTTADDDRNGYRVMRLKHPQTPGATVKVWFNAKHGFPVEARWLSPDGATERRLELKGAKRHANGLWFVREMRLEDGQGQWKTMVRFDYVEKNAIGQ